jgi:uncharacterized membrane protein
MGRGMLIGGIVVAIIGVLLLAGGYAIQQSATSQTIPAGDALSLTPTSVGSASVSLSWSGASSTTAVYFTSGSANCPASGALASGTGASGKLTATLSSGTTYSVYACNGANYTTVSVSYTYSELSVLMIIGIVLLVIGIILAVLSRRRKKPLPIEAPAPTAAPVEP